MATLIHKLKVEVWIREQIAQMGEDEFFDSLERALTRYKQTGQIEAVDPASREQNAYSRTSGEFRRNYESGPANGIYRRTGT